MRISTSDFIKNVDVGTGSVWYSVFSTAAIRLSADDKNFLDFAMRFLKTGECKSDDAQITARQMELLKKRFEKLPPTAAVYDMNNPDKKAPWYKNISKQVISCGNLYTTADGKDLLTEIIDLLKYASVQGTDVSAT